MEVYVLITTRRWNDDPSTDKEEVNAVFDSKEKAEDFGRYITSLPSIDDSNYIQYNVIDFSLL